MISSSVVAGVEDADAFLQRCSESGDAAYAELKAVLGRLHDPATRRGTRVFLGALRRRFSSPAEEDGCFRRYNFRIHDLHLHDGLPTTTTFLSVSAI